MTFIMYNPLYKYIATLILSESECVKNTIKNAFHNVNKPTVTIVK